VIVAVLVVGVVIYLVSRPPAKEPMVAPAGAVYFTGAMMSKSGTYATEDGTRVMGPPPKGPSGAGNVTKEN
jgi:hypothetical protein